MDTEYSFFVASETMLILRENRNGTNISNAKFKMALPALVYACLEASPNTNGRNYSQVRGYRMALQTYSKIDISDCAWVSLRFHRAPPSL